MYRILHVDLKFYTPENTNYFIDAMCIPSCCQNKELAEIFINYMLSPEPAIANAEYIIYGCPNSLVFTDEGYIADMDEEAMEILYPGFDNFAALGWPDETDQVNRGRRFLFFSREKGSSEEMPFP